MENPIPDLDSFLAHRGWIRALARRLVGEGAADDLVQEAWLTLLRSEGPRDRGAFGAWMATVLRRRARDLARGDGKSDARLAGVLGLLASGYPEGVSAGWWGSERCRRVRPRWGCCCERR